MKLSDKILVLGARGMVGSAIVRNLTDKGYTNVIGATREDVDLTKQKKVKKYFSKVSPDYVFLAAAKVGGIRANSTQKADFITQNLQIQTNVISNSYEVGVKKLLFLGSSCIYPKFANQPITEDQLLTGLLEPTNDAYAIAKIAGIKMCQAYREQYGFNAISLMPTNLYGENDSFDIMNSHVIPAIMLKMIVANVSGDDVHLYGDGTPRREFLNVDDLAEACYVCMKKYDNPEPINVGTGIDVTIREVAEMIADVVGFRGKMNWDTQLPNGTPRKVLDVSKMKSLGWEPTIELRDGLKEMYDWYLDKH